MMLLRLWQARKKVAVAAFALTILGLGFSIYQRGYTAAETAAETRENQSEIETGRAIDEAPVFNHSDPSARDVLCAISGRPDCGDL